MEIVRLILYILLSALISTVFGTASYTDYLYNKYGKPVKNKKNNPKAKVPLWKRPFRPGWENRYHIRAKRRNRFLFFLRLTRFNYLIDLFLIIFVFLCSIFNILTFETLETILILKIITVDAFLVLCCIPFGYIVVVVYVIFSIVWNDSATSSGGEHLNNPWWG